MWSKSKTELAAPYRNHLEWRELLVEWLRFLQFIEISWLM